MAKQSDRGQIFVEAVIMLLLLMLIFFSSMQYFVDAHKKTQRYQFTRTEGREKFQNSRHSK
jgi:hypothetical protein